jgi:uncharacterized protein YybS (DUF2232 family)
LPNLKIFDIFISHISFFRISLFIAFFIGIGAFVPVFGFVFLIFIPMLIFFQSIILGKGKTAAAFFLPFLLLLLFSYLLKINTPYIMIFLMAIAGLIIALSASRNLSVEKTIIYPALIILAVICSYFIYGSFQQNITPWQVVQKFVTESVEEIIRILSQQSTDNEYIDIFKNNKNYIISFFTNIFPAIIVIISIFIVWINLLMGRDVLSKRGIVFPRFEGINAWKSPDFLIWIFIISGGLLFISNEQVNFYSLNIFIIASFIYSLQGFAIIGFLFRTKNVPIIFRYLFYFLIAVQQFLMIAIVAAGVFDIWIDFRRFIRETPIPKL